MKFITRIATISCAVLTSASAAQASDYLNVYAGYFDVTQSDNAALQVGAEYRYDDVYHGLRPGVGFNVTNDDAIYGYGGFFWDLYLSDSVVFTPNVVVGGFSHGDGKKLGHGIEFRSGLELNYQFEQGERVGLAFNHISNASLGDHNPGAETLLVNYQYPLNWFADAPKKPRWWEQSAQPVQPTAAY